MGAILEETLRDSEIHISLKSFIPLKFPDLMVSILYYTKDIGTLVWPTIEAFFHMVLSEAFIPEDTNNNFLYIILTTSIKNFKLIGLCNTSYKLKTKINM